MRAIAVGFQLASLVVSATGEASLLSLSSPLGVRFRVCWKSVLYGFLDCLNHEILQGQPVHSGLNLGASDKFFG